MFEWINMIGTYEQRKVDCFKNDLFIVDTVMVTDRAKPYETAVKHKYFNNGDWIVTEYAATKKEAQEVHNKWVRFFNNSNVTEIKDAYTGEIFRKE